MDIFFELENARRSADAARACQSLASIIESAKFLDIHADTAWRLWILRDRDFSAQLLEEIRQIHHGIGEGKIQHVQSDSPHYFGLKNLAAKLGKHDNLVFCDSDCIYESSYLYKMKKGFEQFPNHVIYGTTYAREGSSEFEQISSLTWLFPPEHLGYGDSWPRSKWANNFGLPRSVLLNTPFPVMALSKLGGLETKQERPLWERETSGKGIVHRQIEAVAYHEQFKSLRDWSKRQLVHGLGTGARLRSEGKKFLATSRSVVRPLDSRIRHLMVLKMRELGPRDVDKSVSVLEIGKFVRLFSVVLVWLLDIRLKTHLP
jgi:hypothetical protein